MAYNNFYHTTKNFSSKCEKKLGVYYPSLFGEPDKTIAYSFPHIHYEANIGIDKYPYDKNVTIYEITFRARKSYVKSY